MTILSSFRQGGGYGFPKYSHHVAFLDRSPDHFMAESGKARRRHWTRSAVCAFHDGRIMILVARIRMLGRIPARGFRFASRMRGETRRWELLAGREKIS
jgi:hypothetical protein